MASILTSSPSDASVEVYTGTNIQVTFDASMDADSITIGTFVVYGPDGLFVDGSISYDEPTKTATFNPTYPLATRSEYTVVIQGGENGVYTDADIWGDVEYLATNFRFTFITNDGRYYTPSGETVPDGVPEDIIYPTDVSYSTTFAVTRYIPANRESNIDPSGVYLNTDGVPEITICFNKPVSISGLEGGNDICAEPGVSIVMRDVLGNPFVPEVDLTSYGDWSVILWQAKFIFGSNNIFAENREIEVTIPSTLTSTDTTSLEESTSFFFTTRYNPLYVGAKQVQLTLGRLVAGIPDDTINRIIHANSILADWYSDGRRAMIQPFLSDLYDGTTSVIRPVFTVDPITGAPEYVKQYVLAKTCLDILRARYLGLVEGLFLSGGPGASKALDDLRITEGSGGSMYSATVGPMIQKLEAGYTVQGSVAYWKAYITGKHRWKPGNAVEWGANDTTIPPKRTTYLQRAGTEQAGTTGF